MTKLEWSDATSYSQGQRGKVPQTAWETNIKGARVWVSRGHRYHPDDWVISCNALDLDAVTLGKTESISSEQARNLAMEKVWLEAKRIECDMGGIADAAYAVHDL